MTSPNSVPPSVPPGVPAGTSSTTYAVFAVLLFLGGAALVVWRFVLPAKVDPQSKAGDDVTATGSATAASPASAKANFQALDDDIPPPLPVSSPGPKAGPAGPAGSVVVVEATGGGGCAGPCAGSAPASLQAAMQGRLGASRRCYMDALSQNPNLKGRVGLSIRVGPTGAVCSVAVTQNEMPGTPVANCVAGTLRAGSYPPPTGGCVDVIMTPNFVPK